MSMGGGTVRGIRWRGLFADIDLHLAILFFILVMLATFVGATSRYLLASSVAGLDELSTILFVWFLYLSMIYCVRTNQNIVVDVVDSFVPLRVRRAFEVFADIVVLAFSLAMTIHSVSLVVHNIGPRGGATPFLSIPYYICYAILPVAFFMFAAGVVVRIFGRLSGPRGDADVTKSGEGPAR